MNCKKCNKYLYSNYILKSHHQQQHKSISVINVMKLNTPKISYKYIINQIIKRIIIVISVRKLNTSKGIL